jgi:hypothetical protein
LILFFSPLPLALCPNIFLVYSKHLIIFAPEFYHTRITQNFTSPTDKL